MIAAIALGIAFGWFQEAATSDQPRVSATDTSYLSCSTWTGKNWTTPTARSLKTTLIESPKGYRAYAEVKVLVKSGSCENTTTLYVASGAGQAFGVAYTQSRGGNGIRLIGWSPNGSKLLAEVNLWEYETDRGYVHVPLIYDASQGKAKKIPALDESLSRFFGPNCEFEAEIEGWKTNEQLLTKVSRTPVSEEYEQHFCVARPRLFVFDLQKGTLQAAQQEPKRN